MEIVPYKRGCTVRLVGVVPLPSSDSYACEARFRDPRTRDPAKAWGFVATLTFWGITTNPEALAIMAATPGLTLVDYRLVAVAEAQDTLLWPAPFDAEKSADLVGSFYATDAGGNVQSVPYDNIALRGLFS